MNIRTDRDLGLIIRERRRALGLGQGALAVQADVSRQWIVEVEKGKPRAQVGLVLRVLRVLGLELWSGTHETRSPERPSAVHRVDIDAIVDRARRPVEDGR